jgi:hypothetical protein
LVELMLRLQPEWSLAEPVLRALLLAWRQARKPRAA